MSFGTILKTINIDGLGEMMPPVIAPFQVLAQVFQMMEKWGTQSPEEVINGLMYLENSPMMWAGMSFLPVPKKKKNKVGEF
jgi:hypothetical protein